MDLKLEKYRVIHDAFATVNLTRLHEELANDEKNIDAIMSLILMNLSQYFSKLKKSTVNDNDILDHDRDGNNERGYGDRHADEFFSFVELFQLLLAKSGQSPLAWHDLIWAINSVRLIRKIHKLLPSNNDSESIDILPHGAINGMTQCMIDSLLLCWTSCDLIQKCKLMASILRLLSYECGGDDNDGRNFRRESVIMFLCEELLECTETKSNLKEFIRPSAAERPSRISSLGLVALHPRPFILSFLMRYIIFCLGKGHYNLIDAALMADIPPGTSFDQCSKKAIMLMGIFDEHEGLLYRMLTLMLDQPIRMDLYLALLYRYDYKVGRLMEAFGGKEHAFRMLIYFKRFYQGCSLAAAQPEWNADVYYWHRDCLLPMLETSPHLRVIAKYLRILLESPSQ